MQVPFLYCHSFCCVSFRCTYVGRNELLKYEGISGQFPSVTGVLRT